MAARDERARRLADAQRRLVVRRERRGAGAGTRPGGLAGRRGDLRGAARSRSGCVDAGRGFAPSGARGKIVGFFRNLRRTLLGKQARKMIALAYLAEIRPKLLERGISPEAIAEIERAIAAA